MNAAETKEFKEAVDLGDIVFLDYDLLRFSFFNKQLRIPWSVTGEVKEIADFEITVYQKGRYIYTGSGAGAKIPGEDFKISYDRITSYQKEQ